MAKPVRQRRVVHSREPMTHQAAPLCVEVVDCDQADSLMKAMVVKQGMAKLQY